MSELITNEKRITELLLEHTLARIPIKAISLLESIPSGCKKLGIDEETASRLFFERLHGSLKLVEAEFSAQLKVRLEKRAKRAKN